MVSVDILKPNKEKLNLFLSQKNYKLVEQLTEIDYLFSKTNV